LSRSTALENIEDLIRQGLTWALDADIEDFFGSVEWDLIEGRLEALLGPEEPCLELVRRWLRAPLSMGGRLADRTRGLPQGCVLSPMLANIVLDRFDEQMSALGFRLVRYADDFVVLCGSQADAERARERVAELLGVMNLELKPAKTRVADIRDGIQYLGYHVDQTGSRDLSQASPAGSRGQSAASVEGESPYPLYVIPPPSRLATKAGRLVVARKTESHLIPWGEVSDILLLGPHQITAQTIREAMAKGISVHFLRSSGAPVAQVTSPGGLLGDGPPHVDLWLAQAGSPRLPGIGPHGGVSLPRRESRAHAHPSRSSFSRGLRGTLARVRADDPASHDRTHRGVPGGPAP
jgi:hypothetical protein